MLPDYKEISFLTKAILSGDLESTRRVLWAQDESEKVDVNECDHANRSPLHAAAYFGKVKICRELIKAGARVNCRDTYGLTPLHLACLSTHSETVQVLLENDADVNSRDKAWHTPLHIAAANNAGWCIKTLHHHSFMLNINVTDREGRTSLHHAAYNLFPATVELLISLGSAVNACDKRKVVQLLIQVRKSGISTEKKKTWQEILIVESSTRWLKKRYRRPLHWAVCHAERDSCEVAKVLVRLGADINAKDKDLYTPLHACANSVQLVEFLLDSGAEIDAKTCEGNTPLHIACMRGHDDVVRVLLAYSAPIDEVNDLGETSLMMAAASAQGEDCMQILLSEGADVNHICRNGQTALHRTAQFGRLGRAEKLLDAGCDMDAKDMSGTTVLHIAAAQGYQALCSALLAKNADPQIVDDMGHNPFHKACLRGSVECCRLFTKLGVDLDVQDKDGMTALHLAANSGSIASLELVVSSGASVNILDNRKRTALHYATAKGTVDAVSNLVLYGANPELCDWCGCTPLHFAACYDLSGTVVAYLLERSRDWSVVDTEGYGVVHYAAAGGNVAGLQRILAGSVLNINTSVTSPITIAVHFGHLKAVQILLHYYGSVIETNSKGETVIDVAARRGHGCIFNVLLLHFKPPPNSLQRALEYAVLIGNFYMVVRLLNYGVSVSNVDHNGRTVLFRAVFTGKLDVVQQLTSHGADILCKDKLGKTPLHLAVQCGRTKVLCYLLGFLPFRLPDLFDDQDFSLMHWACYRCHPSCLDLLLEHDVSWSGHAFTPFHAASTHANERCLSMLLNSYDEADLDLRDHKGRTPLHIAALCNSISCMKLLLALNAQHDAIDGRGRTPLDLAATAPAKNLLKEVGSKFASGQ